jgi:hypothetical protein
MSPPEGAGAPPAAPRYGRYVGLLAIVILILITINTIVTKPIGAGGVGPGERLPPFAVPLVTGERSGDANVSTSGRAPACTVRGAGVLNVCQLYEQSPVVLALFVDGGSCPNVLSEMQSLQASFPTIRFAAVAIKGDRRALRAMVRKRRLTFPVGLDDQGDLAALYRLATCPQVNFALKGGRVQSRALLRTPSTATLRARVSRLLAASARAGGGS